MSSGKRREIESGNRFANWFDDVQILIFWCGEIGDRIRSLPLVASLDEVIQAAVEHFKRDALKGQVHGVGDGITEIDQDDIK